MSYFHEEKNEKWSVFSLLATLDATKKVAFWTKRIEVVGMVERMFPCCNRHFDENLNDEKNLKAFWKARS